MSKNKAFLLIFLLSMCVASFLMGQKFVLMIPLYNETDNIRTKEYITCIEKNLKHPSINHIHVIFDESNWVSDSIILNYLKSLPITITYDKKRATYGDFFAIANKYYDNCAIILSNADIYFDDSLAMLEYYDLSNKFLALTRWEKQPNNSEKIYLSRWDNKKKLFVPLQSGGCGSQDVWIFKTPLRTLKIDTIAMGTPFCDGTIAYQAKDAGLDVFNPCYTIKCFHMHSSNIRHWQWLQPVIPTIRLPFTHLKQDQ